MITRGAFNHLLRPGLRKDFRDSYMQYEEEYSRILRVGNMDRAEVEVTTIAGLPRQVMRGEQEGITYVDPKLGPKVIYEDDEYALGFIVSKRMMEDDQYGKANQSSKWLGRSVRLTQEHLAADFLDDAFDGNQFTGYNGEALIATDHELLNDAATWSNRIAGDLSLSVAGLQAMHELAEQTVDHNGEPIPIKIDTIICNIAQEWAAIQLLQNESEPYTANNNLNATRRKRQLSYVLSHYKDQSGSDWFGRDSQNHDAHFLFRIKPEFMDSFDFDTLAAKFAARQRIMAYFYDPRGWIGSNAA